MEHKESIAINPEGEVCYRKLAIKETLGMKRQKTTQQRKVSGVDLFGRVGDSYESEGKVLPIGTRLCESRNDKTIFVIEEPPRVMTTFWSLDFIDYLRDYLYDNKLEKRKNMERKQKFSLAFPYIIYVIRFNRGKDVQLFIYYRTEPLMSTKDFLFRPNLPNNEWGAVCTGNILGDKSNYNDSETYARQIREIITAFWASEFNGDLSEGFYHYMLKGAYYNHVEQFRTLWEWEKASKENPMFPLRVCWTGLDSSIERKLDSIFNVKATFKPPSRQEEVFDFLRKRISKARPLDLKGLKKKDSETWEDAQGNITGFTEHGETFSVGDILIDWNGRERPIIGFRKCGSGERESGCSSGRLCPCIILEERYPSCLFNGHKLAQHKRK